MGAVLGKTAVPTLVDSHGYFFASHAGLSAHNTNSQEMEKELRAQLKRDLDSGLQIDYLDIDSALMRSGEGALLVNNHRHTDQEAMRKKNLGTNQCGFLIRVEHVLS